MHWKGGEHTFSARGIVLNLLKQLCLSPAAAIPVRKTGLLSGWVLHTKLFETPPSAQYQVLKVWMI